MQVGRNIELWSPHFDTYNVSMIIELIWKNHKILAMFYL